MTEQLKWTNIVQTMDKKIDKLFTSTGVSLTGLSDRLAALFTRVLAIEKKKRRFFGSDMSTLPALLSQLETHREEPE
jgi:hypothetical protein